MKNLKLFLVTLLTLAAIPLAPILPASAQNQSTALERGFRTGYSDGYNAGFNDMTNRQPREFQSKEEYQRADRSYNEVWGPVEDYRDGYQQGFEAGYSAGYDKESFNSSIPANLSRRSIADSQNDNQPTTPNENQNVSNAPVNSNGTVSLPRETVMLVELLSPLSTDATQRGDRFEARVVEPHDLDGAIVEGRISRVKRPGKVKGVAELQLDFRTIRLPDRRVADLSADVIEVLPMSGHDNVGDVDPEGGVRGRDSTKDDVSKVGAATGIGAIIGAIAGGGKGAAIGAAIGGGIGTGGVLSQRGKDIRLERGQQLRIRTATDVAFNAQVN
jgi:hypothetical protein